MLTGIISGSSILPLFSLSRTESLPRSPHRHWATPSPGNPATSEPSAYRVASTTLAMEQQLLRGGNPHIVTRTSFFETIYVTSKLAVWMIIFLIQLSKNQGSCHTANIFLNTSCGRKFYGRFHTKASFFRARHYGSLCGANTVLSRPERLWWGGIL